MKEHTRRRALKQVFLQNREEKQMQFQITKRAIPTVLITTLITTVLFLAAAQTNSKSGKLSSLDEDVSPRLLIDGQPTRAALTPTRSPTPQFAPLLDVPV